MLMKKQFGKLMLAGVLGLGVCADVAASEDAKQTVVDQAENEAVKVLSRVHELLRKHNGKISTKQLSEFEKVVLAVAKDEGLKADIRGEAWTVLGKVRLTMVRLTRGKTPLGGLDEVSRELKKLGSHRQMLMAQFWEMQGLIENDRQNKDVLKWKRELENPMKRLRRFYYAILGQKDDDQGTGRRMANNTGLMLLELYDRLGMSEELLGLSILMRCDLRVEKSMREMIAKRYAHYDQIGRATNISVKTENLGRWDLKQYRGKDVVVYFYKFDGFERLIKLQQSLNGAIRGAKNAGAEVAVLFVQLDDGKEQVQGEMMPGIACYQEAEGKTSLSRLFGITKSHRAVLINQRGEVMGLGSDAGAMRWLSGMAGKR